MKETPLVATLINIEGINIETERLPTVSKTKGLNRLKLGKIEASSLEEANYLSFGEAGVTNDFLYMLSTAFSCHKPIVLSPDQLWLLICQGFAEHLKRHANTFRKRLVGHKGKETITVQRDEHQSLGEHFPFV